MSGADDEDDDVATVIGRADDAARAIAKPGVESPTRPFDVRAISNPTRAMPSGYGQTRGGLGRFPAARPSSPRPAAGRPPSGRAAGNQAGVPSIVDDPTSESEMTLIEAIDAELDSITSELSIPEGTHPDILDDTSSDGGRASELTVRMAVPDDLPSNLLDATSEPGTIIQPPRPPPPPSIAEMKGAPAPPLSLSSMPTPPRGARTVPMPPADDGAPKKEITAPLPDIGAAPIENTAPLPAGALARAAVVSEERPLGPAPKWVGRYLVACVLVSLLGAAVLVYLKMNRFW